MSAEIQKLADSPGYRNLLEQISDTYIQGRMRAVQAVNAHITETYWQVGRHIIEFEQGGKARADYGAALLAGLSSDLTVRHGKGFSRSNLIRIRQFYLAYPIGATLSHKLMSWSHIVELLKIDDPLERGFYEQQTLREREREPSLHKAERDRSTRVRGLVFSPEPHSTAPSPSRPAVGTHRNTPFALSLACPELAEGSKGIVAMCRGFDKLSPNGDWAPPVPWQRPRNWMGHGIRRALTFFLKVRAQGRRSGFSPTKGLLMHRCRAEARPTKTCIATKIDKSSWVGAVSAAQRSRQRM